MSLVDKKSLYDRNYRNSLGSEVGTSLPRDGGYFTNEGTNASPFLPGDGNTVAAQAGKDFDHMVHLLHSPVASRNSATTYLPSPNQSEFNDFITNPKSPERHPSAQSTLGQFGGPYKNTGPSDGFYW